MALPGKMFKLKEWLTVQDAARHLSIMFGEEVNEADVLRLALDRHLRLSVNIVNGASVRRGGKFLPFEEWEKKFRSEFSWEGMKPVTDKDHKLGFYFPGTEGAIFPCNGPKIQDSLATLLRPAELKEDFLKEQSTDQHSELLATAISAIVYFGNQQSEKFGGKIPPDIMSFRKEISSIRGIWDLPMMGSERNEIEHEYQQLTGGPEVTLQCLDGTFVEGADGQVCQLQERFDENEFCCDLEQKNTGIDSLKKYYEERKKKPYNHPDNYFPAGGLPKDSVLVVRTTALVGLQERLVKEDEETANVKSTKDGIGTKERGTWLKIIYLLALKLADARPAAYLKADGSFNMSKFEDVLKNKAGDLSGTDDNINNSGHGLSNDNLKKIFDEAKTLF